jgi:hypothetical protein
MTFQAYTNNIACLPYCHLASVFTMILKAGLQGFCPNYEGPVQSNYNELHRHLAVSGFQFLAESYTLSALEVDNKVAANTELLCDMYNNYTYRTLGQKTKMERRRPGSLAKSIERGVDFKARGWVCLSFFPSVHAYDLFLDKGFVSILPSD